MHRLHLFVAALCCMALAPVAGWTNTAHFSLGDFTFSPPVAKPGDEITITTSIKTNTTELRQVRVEPAFSNYWPARPAVHFWTPIAAQDLGAIASNASKPVSFKVKLPATASLGTYYVTLQVRAAKPNIWPYFDKVAKIQVTKAGTPEVVTIPQTETIAVPSGMRLTFNDTFKNGLNKTVWNTHHNFIAAPNAESQAYVPHAFSAAPEGGLRITAKKETFLHKAWTSGEITTNGSFYQTYGRFEIKFKMSQMATSVWPAFWLLPANGQWPPELDVVELMLNGSKKTQLVTTPHVMINGQKQMFPKEMSIKADDAYHVYAMDWRPEKLTWYFDGKEVYSYKGAGIPAMPMFMIANLALGGGGWIPKPNATTPLINHMDIAYIRAFQFNDLKEPAITSTLFDKVQASAYSVRAGEQLVLDSKLRLTTDITSKSWLSSTAYNFYGGELKPLVRGQIGLPNAKQGERVGGKITVKIPATVAPGVYNLDVQAGLARPDGKWSYPNVNNALVFTVLPPK